MSNSIFKSLYKTNTSTSIKTEKGKVYMAGQELPFRAGWQSRLYNPLIQQPTGNKVSPQRILSNIIPFILATGMIAVSQGLTGLPNAFFPPPSPSHTHTPYTEVQKWR